MSERLLFLSDEWITKARGLQAEVEDHYGDRIPPPPARVAVNVRITDIPHRDDLDGHIDTTSGAFTAAEGWVDHADVAVTTDYLTAAELFVAASPDEFMATMMPAVMRGRILVEGSLAQIMPLLQQQAEASAEVPTEMREVAARLQAFTEV